MHRHTHMLWNDTGTNLEDWKMENWKEWKSFCVYAYSVKFLTSSLLHLFNVSSMKFY